MKYIKYFISYAYPHGFGNIELDVSLPITSYKQIRDLQEYICKEYKLISVSILWYTRLS